MAYSLEELEVKLNSLKGVVLEDKWTPLSEYHNIYPKRAIDYEYKYLSDPETNYEKIILKIPSCCIFPFHLYKIGLIKVYECIIKYTQMN